jgi:hypothetical protein
MPTWIQQLLIWDWGVYVAVFATGLIVMAADWALRRHYARRPADD